MKKLISAILVVCFIGALIAQQTPPNYPYPKPRPNTGLNNAVMTKTSQALGPSAFSNPEPPIWARDVAGGLFSVKDGAERLALPLVVEGMLVYDASDGTFYSSYLNGKVDLPLFQLNGTWLGPTLPQFTVNIYNTDGIITSTTGQRIVNLGTNTLGFINGGGFLVDVPGGVRLQSLSNNVDLISGQAIHLDSGNFIDVRAPNDLNLFGRMLHLCGTNMVEIMGHNTVTVIATNGLYLNTKEVLSGGVAAKIGQVLTMQPDGTSEFKPPGGAGTTIYTGDGAITSDRIVHLGSVPGDGKSLHFDLNGNTFDVIGGPGSSIDLEAPVVQFEASSGFFPKTPEVLSGGVAAKVGQVLTMQADGRAEFKPSSGGGGSALNSGIATLAGGLYTVASPSPPFPATSYTDFLTVELRVPGVNAGGETLKWGSGPAKPIKLSGGQALPAGELTSGVNYLLSFNTTGDYWILKNPAGTFQVDTVQDMLGMTTPAGSTISTLSIKTANLPGFYTANGTLSSTRTVTMSGNPLIFNGSSGADFTVNTVGSVLIKGDSGVTIQTPGHGAATTGQALRKTATGTVEYGPDPAGMPSIAQNRILGQPNSGSATPISTALNQKYTIIGGTFKKDYDRIIYDFEDWGNLVGYPWASTPSNGGTAINNASLGGKYGLITLTAGTTTANGYSMLTTRFDAFEMNTGNMYYFEGVYMWPVLSTAAQQFKTWLGFMDATPPAAQADAFCFSYTDDGSATGNNGKICLEVWQNTTGGVTAASVGSSLTVTANQWYKFVIVARPSGIQWSIDDVAQPVITANIPSGSTRKFGVGMVEQGIAGTGGVARQVYYDRCITYGVYSELP